jgi:hypothetical protein
MFNKLQLSIIEKKSRNTFSLRNGDIKPVLSRSWYSNIPRKPGGEQNFWAVLI